MADEIGNYLEAGQEVEVINKVPNKHTMMLPAIIIQKGSDTAFLVEYKAASVAKPESSKIGSGSKRKSTGGVSREEVDVELLRPVPARESDDYEFRFAEKVDALFGEGWRYGVVVDVKKNLTFDIFLEFEKKPLKFALSEIRVHRDWVNGAWDPPLQEKQEMDVSVAAEETPKKKMKLSKGADVEVRSDEDGLQGAWFAATVVKTLGKDKFLIEHKNIMSNDKKELLTEEVDSQHVRPNPPECVAVDAFSLNEKVDAMYRDAWWEGEIIKVLRGGKYRVHFEGTGDRMTFEHSLLRQHQDWTDGKWVLASQATEDKSHKTDP
ncbi:protein AGENET DOMAIN (AGD)-CONTAINING P1-like [Ziziphus jujuba]|uniref:Protein AGENET DOMAIN (AGD)-CONTAINING P1-like n=1 Tax=Ziziphus jujuba TaxID=326968 RepID=A0A6P6G1K8_ZIZJJ|nr:protein AGENET DOMAIN (AGD)-CONTAINING P1-like [Ziziphus jujuba]